MIDPWGAVGQVAERRAVSVALSMLGPSLAHLTEGDRRAWDFSTLKQRLRREVRPPPDAPQSPGSPNPGRKRGRDGQTGTIPPHFQSGLTSSVMKRGRGRPASETTLQHREPESIRPKWESMARVLAHLRETEMPPLRPRKDAPPDKDAQVCRGRRCKKCRNITVPPHNARTCHLNTGGTALPVAPGGEAGIVDGQLDPDEGQEGHLTVK